MLAPQHVHVHLHQSVAKALSEIHWHIYLEPWLDREPSTDIQNLQIINPPSNAPWNVRPPTPGSTSPGYICADGVAMVDGEPADSVWAFIFDHLPTAADVATIPPGAVCGKIDSHTGKWVFRHDTPECTAGPHGLPGQMGTEIPGAKHSASGIPNWLAVWGKKGSTQDVDIHRFLGITSSTTSCGGSAGMITGPMVEPAALPPLPAAFLANFKNGSRKPSSVRLEYSHAASQSHRPVWLSQCALWRLSIEMIEDSLLAQLDGRWSAKDDSVQARWSGLLVPEKKRNKLLPIAPAKVLSGMSPVELEGTQ